MTALASARIASDICIGTKDSSWSISMTSRSVRWKPARFQLLSWICATLAASEVGTGGVFDGVTSVAAMALGSGTSIVSPFFAASEE